MRPSVRPSVCLPHGLVPASRQMRACWSVAQAAGLTIRAGRAGEQTAFGLANSCGGDRR